VLSVTITLPLALKSPRLVCPVSRPATQPQSPIGLRLSLAVRLDNHFLLPDLSLSGQVRPSSFLGVKRRQRSDHELIRPGLVNVVWDPLAISDIRDRQPVQYCQTDGLTQRQRLIELGDNTARQTHSLVAMV